MTESVEAITWFAPDRPVEGNVVYVRPQNGEIPDPGATTPPDPGSGRTRSERQSYALAHPSSDPRGLLADRGLWRDEVARDGNVLRTALAVDR